MSESITQLTLLLDKKIEYLKEMLSTMNEQNIAIKNEEVEKISSLLDKNDILIQNIDEIDKVFKERKTDQLLENRVIIEKIKDIQDILNRMKLIDDENNKKLKNSIENTKTKLKEIRQGKKVMKGYDNNDPYKSFGNYGGTLFINQDS